MTECETVAVSGAQVDLYRRSPDWDGRRTAAVGGIRFDSTQAGVAVLERAADMARREGYQALLGPLDGDTWHSYRLIVESDGSPPFLLEPTSGAFDLQAFTAAGFTPVSRYISAIAALADTLGEAPAAVPGIVVEPWDGTDGETLIRRMFDLSSARFADNRFFTPIGFDAFLGLYRPLLPLIDKDHVLFARDEAGAIRGFLFGMPDPFGAPGAPRCILKTYASGVRGAGHLLADSYHRRALDMGFGTVIHALMHEDNVSRDRSARHGARVFRRYALMGRTL